MIAFIAVSEWVTLIGAVLAMVMSLAGWAYQIGVQNTRSSRAENDVKFLQEKMINHHERTDLHVSEEWRTEIRNALSRLEIKIDRLPCKSYRPCDEIDPGDQGRT